MRTMMISTLAAMAALGTPALADPYGVQGSADIRLNTPIAGVENDAWFDYQTDTLEAEDELESDLARATDTEDRFEARVEYEREIADALADYQAKMINAGYPVGRVTVVGDR